MTRLEDLAGRGSDDWRWLHEERERIETDHTGDEMRRRDRNRRWRE